MARVTFADWKARRPDGLSDQCRGATSSQAPVQQSPGVLGQQVVFSHCGQLWQMGRQEGSRWGVEQLGQQQRRWSVCCKVGLAICAGG